jgi:hypothetical protein
MLCITSAGNDHHDTKLDMEFYPDAEDALKSTA